MISSTSHSFETLILVIPDRLKLATDISFQMTKDPVSRSTSEEGTSSSKVAIPPVSIDFKHKEVLFEIVLVIPPVNINFKHKEVLFEIVLVIPPVSIDFKHKEVLFDVVLLILSINIIIKHIDIKSEVAMNMVIKLKNT